MVVYVNGAHDDDANLRTRRESMFAKRSLGGCSAAGIATLAAFSVAYATDLPQAVPTAPMVLAQSKSTSTADEGHRMTAHPAMTPELKKDLADMYQKMADCLRSDKSLDQCSHEAMENCPVVKKTGHCPINEGSDAVMGKGMKRPTPGMGKGDMSTMKDSAPPTSDK